MTDTPIEISAPSNAGIPPPAPNFYRRHTRSLWLSLITIAVAVGALLSYILFFRTVETPPEYSGDVKLQIIAPEESVSGSQISYEIDIENLSSTKLTELNLEIFYPEGFDFLDSTPGASETGGPGRNFQLSDLPKNGKYKLVIVGLLKGNVQEIKSITAKLHYIPENFSSSFLASSDASTVMLPPEISMRVLAPTHLIAGQLIKYEIEISNVSIEDFENLALELSYPPGFSFGSASPAPTGGETSWRLPTLTFGDTQKIVVEGRLTERPNEDVYISAELFTDKDGDRLSAGRSYAFTRVLAAPIKLTHALRGGAGTVLAGEDLEYEIGYENIGDVGLGNVTITMAFETPVFDLLEAKSDTGQIRGNKMVWQPAAVPELRIVNPGQKGKFTVRVQIKEEAALSQKNPVAQTRTEFRADTLTETLAGDTLVFKVGTNITLDAQSQVISGPARPEIGQTTVYRITLRVANSVNDLENAQLTAVVPRTDTAFISSSVTPSGESTNLQYLPNSRSIIWKLGQIPAFSGRGPAARTVTFDLSIAPEASGFGSYSLLKDIEVQGLDSFTNELVFSQKIRSIDTQ